MHCLATEDDFIQIASIYKKRLNNISFLSERSIEFLAFFYREICSYDSTVLLVEKSERGSVQGFIFCSTDRNQYYKRFFIENIFVIILHGSILIPLIKFGIQRFITKNRHPLYKSELVQIVVDNQFQGTGIGKGLIVAAEEEFRRRNIFEYYLQVFSENRAAIDLYQSIGFEIVSPFAVGKRTKYLMKRVLK